MRDTRSKLAPMTPRQEAPPSPAVARVLRAAGGRLLALPVTAVFALLTTRVIIHDVGSTQFAFLSLIISVSAFLPFADLGVGAAIVNATAESKQPSDDPALIRVLATSLRAIVASACVLMTVDALITWQKAWPMLLGTTGAAASQVNIAAGLSLAVFAASLPLSIGHRILLGLGRNGTLVLLQALNAPVAFMLTIAAVRTKAGLPLLALATPAGMMGSSLLVLMMAGRLSGLPLGRLYLNLTRLGVQPGTSIRRTARPMLVITLGLPLALQTDRLILAHAGTISELASYALAMQLYAPAWSVLATAGLSLWPIFAKLRRDDNSGVATLKSAGIAFAAAGFAGGIALVAATPLLANLLAGHKVSVPLNLALSFGLLLLVQSLQLPIGMFLTSADGLRFQACCIAVMVPVSCLISYFTVKPLGAAAPVVGSIVAIVACQILPGVRFASRGWPAGQFRR
jgi:O-antigen/teichoic acid export membrane protein